MSWSADPMPDPAGVEPPARVLPDDMPDNVLMMVAVVLPDGMTPEIAEQLGGLPAVLQIALNAPPDMLLAVAERLTESIRGFIADDRAARAESN